MSLRDILAKTLMAEAGGEGPQGMLAAGAVMQNRVRTGGYGNDLHGVIMKPGQFSAWNGVTGYANGQGALDMHNMRPSETAYQVADMVMSGNYEDPTGGATHYYNPSVANPKWGERNGGKWNRIGNHIFGNADAGRVSGGGSTPTVAGGLSITPSSPPDTLQGAQMQPEQQQRQHMFLKNMDPATRDRLIVAMQGMTMNPNQGLMGMAQQNMQDRATAGREAKAEAKGAEQRNRTAEWLMTQPGGEQYAQAIASGALPAAAALQMWQKVGAGPDQTAKQQQIARIKGAFGVDDQTAVGIADGVLNVSRDPFDQSVVVTNLATGESYSPQAQQQAVAPEPSEPIQTEALPPAPDASNAFGLEGMIKGAINSASDTVGLGTPYEGVRQSQDDFAVLREDLTNSIASAYNRQPPSWLMKNIQDLTPQAGGLGGAEGAQSKLDSLRRNFVSELVTAKGQLGTRMAPVQQRALAQRINALEASIGKVEGALAQFGAAGGSEIDNIADKWDN